MEKGVLFEVDQNFTRDSLYEFVNSLRFIPNGFGHQCNDPLAVCSERITADFELIYIVGGESNIRIEQTQYNCRIGDLIFIPPFIRNEILTPISNPHDCYWMHFDVHPFYKHEDLIKTILLDGEYKRHIGLIDELIYLYEKMNQEAALNEPGSLIFINACIIQIVTTILRHNKCSQGLEKIKSGNTSSDVALVDKSIEYILDNIYNQLDIAALCKHSHVSKPYLFKAFSKVLKMPPNKFIQLCKMKKAEQMIKITSLSMKEISQTLGFSSQYYFCNVFKKFFGVSPKEYSQDFK